MQSLAANLTQSQQITQHLHQQHRSYCAPQQNTKSYQFFHWSPSPFSEQTSHTSRNFYDRSVFHSNISSQSRQTMQSLCSSVSDGLQSRFVAYNHDEKVSCLLDVIRIYRKLVSDHGLFLLTKDHLKIDCIGRAMVFISPETGAKQPSLPLNPNKYHQLKVVQQFIDLFRKHFSHLFFKYAKIRNLEDLENFFILVRKRNQIHKRCKHIVRMMRESNVKTCVSSNYFPCDISASKRFDLQHAPCTSFAHFHSKPNISSLASSKHFPSAAGRRDSRKQSFCEQRKSELDTTSISNSILRQPKSYQQEQSIGRTDAKRKSCVVKTTHEENIMLNFAKNSSVVAKKEEYRDEFARFMSREHKRDEKSSQMKPKWEIEGKIQSSLQLGLKDLFLSEIVQGSENEILCSGGNHGNLNQFFEDFENVFY